ncbi:2-oxo-3-hexenedioate decarboxylase [Xanthobacter autotrophicus]|uniref:2-oxo-3-hexenedioate decarboxylase n=2 Tax=Xanthobacter autotrophicus TaxID=280 RepID=A0A6C1KCZ8_XANAU|nr:2-oxo-3-hexenedioate decarboxylase [Xanthobacter autotrophicus]
MALDWKTLEAFAEHLENAELERRAITKITDDCPDLSWEEAYAIQDCIRARKVARGVRITGLKMGLTSLAKMTQMGVEDPIHGFITDYGMVPDGGEIAMDALIHPKVEAEVGFVLKRPLSGPGVDIDMVLAATDRIVPAVEVIDSRYRDFRFDLKSVIADNTSAARYVVGSSTTPFAASDLHRLNVVLEKNGSVVAEGVGATVLGHPAASVAMLANMLGRKGEGWEVPAEALILTGGITEAVPVARGDWIDVRYKDFGSVSLHFV